MPSLRSLLYAVLLSAAPAVAQTVLYSQTQGTTPPAVVNTDPNFTYPDNCAASEGCFYKQGQGVPATANLPAQFTFNFSVSPQQLAAITASGGVGRLTVTAARDLGHKAGAAPDDALVTTIDGSPLGSMFLNAIDSCPAGERGTDYSQTLLCGINFHTDVTATESVAISTATFASAAADGTVTIAMTPTANVGRVKIFAVTLEFVGTTPVPALDPRLLVALALAVGVVGWRLARR
jgi:hypothetical protein